jgi:ABC-type phosphate transport system substrate-binding protein
MLTTSPGSAGEMVRLKGSGASFPLPIYGLWCKEYGTAHRNVISDYQAKGSGAGVRDFVNKMVDFAASDAAMTDAQMQMVMSATAGSPRKRLPPGVVQIPCPATRSGWKNITSATLTWW